jgi:nitroreductase
MTDFLALAKSRYSVRSFANTPVPEELLEKVLEAGQLAPTAMNRQPQRVYVLRSGEALEKLQQVKPCYNAPLVLLVCGDTSVACDRPVVGRNLAEMDASIVATHMMLEAADCGLGSVWICAFDTERLAQTFDLPAATVPYMLLALGYPAEDCQPNPRHTQRLPLEDTVTVL